MRYYSLLILLFLLFYCINPVDAYCNTTVDCNGSECILTNPIQLSYCNCPAGRYESNYQLSINSASTDRYCLYTIKSLYNSLYIAHQIVLIILWSILIIIILLVFYSLYYADQLTFKDNSISIYILLLLIITSILKLLYNCIDPLLVNNTISSTNSTNINISTATDIIFSYISDLIIFICYFLLYNILRNALLLSPIITDKQYNRMIANKSVLTVLFIITGIIILVLLFIIPISVQILFQLFLSVTLSILALFTIYLLFSLYSLSSIDSKLLSGISIAPSIVTVDMPIINSNTEKRIITNHSEAAAAATEILQSTGQIAIITVQPATAAAADSHRKLLSATSFGATVEENNTTNNNNDIPLSTTTTTTAVPYPGNRSRRQSIQLKQYNPDRLNVHRMIRLNVSCSIGIIIIYAIIAAESLSINAEKTLILHFVRDLILIIWTAVLSYSIRPTKRAVVRATRRRSSINANHSAAASAAAAAVLASNDTMMLNVHPDPNADPDEADEEDPRTAFMSPTVRPDQLLIAQHVIEQSVQIHQSMPGTPKSGIGSFVANRPRRFSVSAIMQNQLFDQNTGQLVNNTHTATGTGANSVQSHSPRTSNRTIQSMPHTPTNNSNNNPNSAAAANRKPLGVNPTSGGRRPSLHLNNPIANNTAGTESSPIETMVSITSAATASASNQNNQSPINISTEPLIHPLPVSISKHPSNTTAAATATSIAANTNTTIDQPTPLSHNRSNSDSGNNNPAGRKNSGGGTAGNQPDSGRVGGGRRPINISTSGSNSTSVNRSKGILTASSGATSPNPTIAAVAANSTITGTHRRSPSAEASSPGGSGSVSSRNSRNKRIVQPDQDPLLL